MLVLSRKPTEAITLDIGGGKVAKVTVCRVAGNRVLLGVDAPREVKITRDESRGRESEAV